MESTATELQHWGSSLIASGSGGTINHLTKDDAPVLIFHGDRDPVVPITRSRLVHERYQEAGLTFALHGIEGAGHGGLRFSDDSRYALVKAFLDRHIKGE